jgi:hypothetical protein
VPATCKPAYVLGAAVALVLAAAVAIASLRGSPVRVGGSERTDTWATVFLALFVLAFVLYLGALFVLRSGRGGVVAVCALAAAIQLTPLAGPLLLSRDSYSYWAYGRIMADHHRDPYAQPPGRFPHDPATRAVAKAWRRATSVYGPAFTFASIGVGDIARRSAELASFLFRIAAAGAGIGATVLAAAIARRKAYAAAFVGWNPVLAISFAGGGHNDALMLMLMLGALALMARRRHAAGGAVWVLAGAVKAPALALLVLQLGRSRRAFALGAGAAAVVVGAIATHAFGTAWLTSIWQFGDHRSRFALSSRLEEIAVPKSVARLLAEIVLAAGMTWLVLQARRGRARLALGASLLILTSPWLLPWYSTWPVALAAVDEDVVGSAVALALAAYLLPARIPW